MSETISSIGPPGLASTLMAGGGGHLDAATRFNPAAFGLICGIGASLLWAAGYPAVRHGLNAGFSPAELELHRYLWSGLAFLPFVMRGGIKDLNGIGWGRAIVLTVLGGPVFALIGYAGLLIVPIGHGGVIQPSAQRWVACSLQRWYWERSFQPYGSLAPWSLFADLW